LGGDRARLHPGAEFDNWFLFRGVHGGSGLNVIDYWIGGLMAGRDLGCWILDAVLAGEGAKNAKRENYRANYVCFSDRSVSRFLDFCLYR